MAFACGLQQAGGTAGALLASAGAAAAAGGAPEDSAARTLFVQVSPGSVEIGYVAGLPMWESRCPPACSAVHSLCLLTCSVLRAHSLCLLSRSLLQAAKVITANAASVGDTLLGVPLLCSTGALRPRSRGIQRGVQFIGAALYHAAPRCWQPCKRRWPVLCSLQHVACSLLAGICIFCTYLSSNPPSHSNHPQASTQMQPASCRTRGCGATPPHWWHTPSSAPAQLPGLQWVPASAAQQLVCDGCLRAASASCVHASLYSGVSQ